MTTKTPAEQPKQPPAKIDLLSLYRPIGLKAVAAASLMLKKPVLKRA